MHTRYRSWIGLAIAFAALFFLVAGLPSITPSAKAELPVPPTGRTGAPPSGSNCSSCHGALNDGTGSLMLLGVPAEYVPGQTYTLSVSLARSGSLRWGFEVTSLFTSGDAYAGLLQSTTNFTSYRVASSKGYVGHNAQGAGGSDGTFAGTANGPVVWTFDWTAPIAGSGEVTFYAAGVAANNDGNDGSGDRTYTTSVSSVEAAPTPTTAVTWGWIKNHYR